MTAKLILAQFVLIGMFASFIVFSFPLRVQSQSEEWTPYVPSASQVELDYWGENDTSYMNVSIWFSNPGYKVSDWGIPEIVGYNISVDAKIWRWTGITLPVITWESHTYILGNLSEAEYSFDFKSWGASVKDTTFIVPEFPSFLILPLFMIVTLLAVIVYKRKYH